MTTHTPGPDGKYQITGRKIGSMVSAAEYGDLLIHCDSLREINAELLAALKNALSFMEQVLEEHSIGDVKTEHAVRAAIAKATQI